ncbi:MAG: YbhB/YbcL family Raf kinase inhibitor-like protein [Candidatus Diapherotrites archaeon]
MKSLKVSSPCFENNGRIPDKYTCKGMDVNPKLIIENLPKETKSLVLIVDDPDAPMGTWDHWIVWNIKPTNAIEENSIPGQEGINSANQRHWHGPCPPYGTHRYFFKVFALDTILKIPENSRKKEVEKAMEGHIIAKGELIGIYSKQT